MSNETVSSIEYFDHRFPNFGFLEIKFGYKELEPIIKEISQMTQNNFMSAEKSNNELVGHIQKEFKLTESRNHLDSIVRPFCLEYDRIYNYLQNINILNDPANVELGTVWVNFQKRHEFNPVHWHKGVFSFVLWIDIPFANSDEIEVDSVKDAAINIPGNFQFLYQNTLGQICTHSIPADKEYNYRMILFPATMRHAVYPFSTVDSSRISVAGNYTFGV